MNYVDKTDLVGSCYRLVINQGRMTFPPARKLCKDEGAELLVIDNEVEQEVVASMLSEVDPTWTFFTDFTRKWGSYYWIGDTKFTSNLFITSWGESLHEVGYAPWEDNKREADIGEWCCIVVNASNGLYTESFMVEKWYRQSYPFCEMRIPKRPPF